MKWNPLSHFFFFFASTVAQSESGKKNTHRDETMMMNYCNNLSVCVCVYFSCEAHIPPC